ncbi:hypothetical protein [Spirosoma oryzicola]|uniref:hypothetical protein n=1 Tax=Spirosoma oryzicola TaxID=2898794 RepID=UPI001E5647EB|nr:hypothetical protein [Spirosoma oryzicola]UHG93315.1 hypothetical protein LQ777_10525 [Spirosoma oryzicola]
MFRLILTDAVENDAVRFKLGETEITIRNTPVDVPEATVKAIESQYPGWTQRVPATKGQTPTTTEAK